VLIVPLDRTRIVRRALIDAVLQERPRIVACAAAAGYGKSVLASELAAHYPSAVECDCSGGGTIAFARSVFTALLEEDPSREEALSAELLGLAADPQLWAESVQSAWRATRRPASVIVFDQIEALDAGARAVLRGLLAAPGVRELFVLCSRTGLEDVLPGRLPPSAVISLTERDLRLSPVETRALFGGQLDNATLREIDELAQGWPLALEVLRRGHRRGRLDSLLHDLHDVEFRALHAYIAEDILAGLDEPELDVLCTLSVLGPCSTSELLDALPHRLWRDVEEIRSLPLVRSERDRLTLHPMLSAFLTRRHCERRARNAGLISEALLERGGDRVQAARIALDGGDSERAAEILERGVFQLSPPAPLGAELVARLDRETLLRHPALWNVTMIYRAFGMSSDDWLAEALSVWEALPLDAPVETVVGVANNAMNVYAIRGAWETLEAFQAALQERHRRSGDIAHPLAQLGATLTAGWVRALRMQHFDLTAFMREIAPLLVVDYVHALVLYDVVARVHAGRGDRAAERRALDEAMIRARRGGVPTVMALCLQEAATTAWFAGELPLFETCTNELEELLVSEPSLTGGVAHFLDCARGRGISARVGSEKPHARALSWLIAAGIAKSAGERRAFLDQALRTADGCRHPHPMILARLATAAALPGAANRWTEAEAIAATVDAVFWQRLFATGVGAERAEAFLGHFRFEAPPEDRVVVRILDGVVECEGKELHLSPKEFSLLALLAVTDAALDTDTLCEALWPKTPLASAAVSLRVYVNRVRKKVGDPGCIEVNKGRYRSATFLRTDLYQIDAFLRTLPAKPTQTDVSIALRRYAALVAGPPAFLVDLPIFSSLNAHVNNLIERIEAWLDAVRERVPESERARITTSLEAVAAS
jgi:hypothetical protein